MTLEQRCRRLVNKWKYEARLLNYKWPMGLAAKDLLAILPKRKRKKPRQEIVYGPTLYNRRKAKKGAKR